MINAWSFSMHRGSEVRMVLVSIRAEFVLVDERQPNRGIAKPSRCQFDLD
jgi:hypothetical protein